MLHQVPGSHTSAPLGVGPDGTWDIQMWKLEVYLRVVGICNNFYFRKYETAVSCSALTSHSPPSLRMLLYNIEEFNKVMCISHQWPIWVDTITALLWTPDFHHTLKETALASCWGHCISNDSCPCSCCLFIQPCLRPWQHWSMGNHQCELPCCKPHSPMVNNSPWLSTSTNHWMLGKLNVYWYILCWCSVIMKLPLQGFLPSRFRPASHSTQPDPWFTIQLHVHLLFHLPLSAKPFWDDNHFCCASTWEIIQLLIHHVNPGDDVWSPHIHVCLPTWSQKKVRRAIMRNYREQLCETIESNYVKL